MAHANSFDQKRFLRHIGKGSTLVEYQKDKKIFSQGDRADSVLYIQTGNVRLTIVSERGKEAVIAILGAGDFLGETCLTGEPVRIASATAITDCTLMKVEKPEMARVLREEPVFSEFFVACLLSNSVRVQERLVDQLLHSSEKRLARTLLLLARLSQKEKANAVLTWITQETLAAMIGTTRETVNHLMNKFRRQGLIHYQSGLVVNRSLLGAVLND
jgi:CRP-like cAMP-binding protein